VAQAAAAAAAAAAPPPVATAAWRPTSCARWRRSWRTGAGCAGAPGAAGAGATTARSPYPGGPRRAAARAAPSTAATPATATTTLACATVLRVGGRPPCSPGAPMPPEASSCSATGQAAGFLSMPSVVDAQPVCRAPAAAAAAGYDGAGCEQRLLRRCSHKLRGENAEEDRKFGGLTTPRCGQEGRRAWR
jgi:hypothetical protein